MVGKFLKIRGKIWRRPHGGKISPNERKRRKSPVGGKICAL
jgi:hypothetical protein